MVDNFRPIDSPSSSKKGADFERAAKKYLQDKCKLFTIRGFGVLLGITTEKERKFDLGLDDPAILVECKSHTWTRGGDIPSGKMKAWNEAMYYFYLAPKEYRKILFVSRAHSESRQETLAEYYVKTYEHLIPEDVEVWEFDGETAKKMN